jgi:uncharacterized protein (TIGR02266 family)
LIRKVLEFTIGLMQNAGVTFEDGGYYMDNKRKHPRIPKKLKSEVATKDSMTYSTARNVSEQGMFVSTPEPISKGSELNLSITMPDGGVIVLKGTVRWTKEESEDGSPAGMGVQFTSLNPEAEKMIKSLLNG